MRIRFLKWRTDKVGKEKEAPVSDFYLRLRQKMPHPQWCVDVVDLVSGQLNISGWMLPLDGIQGRGAITINGSPPDVIKYGQPRKDIEQIYGYFPNALFSGFSASKKISTASKHIEVSYVETATSHTVCEHHNFYIPLFDETNIPIPDQTRRNRNTGPTNEITFQMGGYSLYVKLNKVLQKYFGRKINEFSAILDWGCGCGRLTRYLVRLRTHAQVVSAADVDYDNVTWCANNLANVKTVCLPLIPPTVLSDRAYDLLIGISVFTHLSEPVQFSWLQELARIARPGAVVLMTFHGAKDLLRATSSPEEFQNLFKKGILDHFHNSTLDGFIPDPSYYRSTFHTSDYVWREWGKYFRIIEIVPDFNQNHQNLVVMQKIK